ncbi:MAG: hypothetical protein ACFWTJ_10570 [Lachnoclostridium sp.]|jgi:hypothetical protein
MEKKSKKKTIKGSLTVEAALVLPIFIYIIVAFLYFLQIIRLQEYLQNAITKTAFYTAKYAFVYDYINEYGTKNNNSTDNKLTDKSNTDNNADINKKTTYHNQSDDTSGYKEKNSSFSLEEIIAKNIDSTYYKLKIRDYLNVAKIDQFCIKDGFNGIHTHLSGFLEEDDAVDIVLSYDIRLPLRFFHIKDIPVLQRVRLRGWTGHKVSLKEETIDPSDQTKDNERMVYITETGAVYHYYKDCSHLDLSVREVDVHQIDDLRNKSGGKYKQCDLCKDSNSDKVSSLFITDFGDRYHNNLNCSGLKRTVITIPISQVGGRKLCNRCGARSE